MKRIITTLSATILLIAPAIAAAGQQYETTQLPMLPEYPYIRTSDINNDGHVAGASWTCPFILSCLSRAWFYDGQLHDVSAELLAAVPPQFAGLTWSADLNNADDLIVRLTVVDVGIYFYLLDDGEFTLINAHPDADPDNPGPLVPVPPPVGATSTTAWQVNDSGMVAGSISLGDPFSPTGHAFRWVKGEGAVDLISPPAEFSSMGALGINNHGHIVGILSDGTLHGRGFLWVDGDLTVLPPLEDDLGSEAWAINDDGLVVGTSQGPSNVDRLVVWHDGEIVDSVTPPFASNVILGPDSVNTAGEVVGYYWPLSDAFQQFGFQWAPNAGFTTLNGTTPDEPGLNIWEATGINDSGQIAVWGEFPDFSPAAFLLTPIDTTGDLDGNGLVDLDDYAILFDCLSGPEVSPPDGCEGADFDDDGDVDLKEVAALCALFTGP